jgi:ketosteroid isomerase-like protein
MEKQNNVATIQQAYADFAAGNIAAIIERCTDDVTWGSYENPGVPPAGTYYGKEGVKEFFTRLANSVDYTDFSPKEFFSDDANNAVFVRGHQAAKVKSTGKSIDHDWLMEFRFRDGKVRSFFAFVDTRDQKEAFTADKENTVRVSLTADKKEESIAHA